HDEHQGEPQEGPVESQPPPNASVPSTSQPTTEPHPDQELETETELYGSSSDVVHTPPTQVETSLTELKSISPEPMKMVLSDSESADVANSSKQGRNLGEKDVASQKTKTYTRKVKSGLKKKLDVGVSSGDRKSAFEKFKSASEEIESGFTNISSGEVRVSQRKGKEVLEEQPQPKRSKKQIREEEANLAEIARIQAQEAAEIERKAKLQRLDELADKRLNDELEMTEQQRKRATEVQQQAQYYTEEDWDLIRARWKRARN
ncbi:hypothetical protein Tco_0919901, partial [Tanacetum coccineum]